MITTGSATQPECPFGAKMEKYWERRHELFSYFDYGIQIDEEGLYSVKPEKNAILTTALTSSNTVLDAFCGVGGSAIAFARVANHVITYDISKNKLSMANNNAAVYNVSEKISFREGDVLQDVYWDEFQSIYLDPPWGGIDYHKTQLFSFSHFAVDVRPTIKSALYRGKDVVISIPYNFDMNELRVLPAEHRMIPQKSDQGRLLYYDIALQY